jgi:hypothetical protein
LHEAVKPNRKAAKPADAIAALLSDNLSAFADTLSRRALFDLAAPSTPEPVVAEIVERVSAGEACRAASCRGA